MRRRNCQAGFSKAASKARRPHPEALLRSKSLEGCSRRRRSIQRAFRFFDMARAGNRPSRPLRGASGRGQLGLRSSSERSRKASLGVMRRRRNQQMARGAIRGRRFGRDRPLGKSYPGANTAPIKCAVTLTLRHCEERRRRSNPPDRRDAAAGLGLLPPRDAPGRNHGGLRPRLTRLPAPPAPGRAAIARPAPARREA